MVGNRRAKLAGGEVEPYVEWIVRSTRIAEERMEEAGHKDWVTSQQLRKKALLEKVITATDDRWSQRLMHWEPLRTRRPGRPRLRWSEAS